MCGPKYTPNPERVASLTPTVAPSLTPQVGEHPVTTGTCQRPTQHSKREPIPKGLHLSPSQSRKDCISHPSQSQRDCISQPRVTHGALPWVCGPKSTPNPERVASRGPFSPPCPNHCPGFSCIPYSPPKTALRKELHHYLGGILKTAVKEDKRYNPFRVKSIPSSGSQGSAPRATLG